MHPQLAAIVADFERARSRMHRIATATPEERWAARPDPARWSVAECIAHLNLTSRAYIPLLRDAFSMHPAAAADGPKRATVPGGRLHYAAVQFPAAAGRTASPINA